MDDLGTVFAGCSISAKTLHGKGCHRAGALSVQMGRGFAPANLERFLQQGSVNRNTVSQHRHPLTDLIDSFAQFFHCQRALLHNRIHHRSLCF